MTNARQVRYLPDANVLMTAFHHYYSPALFPGFWHFLSHHFAEGNLVMIDRVCDEILYPSELVSWVVQAVDDPVASTATQQVVDAYVQLMDWVQDNPQFNPSAREDFARSADGWLVAYAMVHGAIVVTNEVSAPESRSKVKLPDLCHRFHVRCINTFEMLRELGASFDWQGP